MSDVVLADRVNRMGWAGEVMEHTGGRTVGGVKKGERNLTSLLSCCLISEVLL